MVVVVVGKPDDVELNGTPPCEYKRLSLLSPNR